jgi:unsaturated chondroitin disaccharide hydrolase
MKRKCLGVAPITFELLERRAMFAAAPLTTAPSTLPATAAVATAPADQTTLQTEITHAWTFALSQIRTTLAALPSGKFPSYTNAKGQWVDVGPSDWTSGFFAGELWQAYKESGSRVLEKAAIKMTGELTPQTSAKDDLAFRFMPTDGLEYQFTDSATAKKVLIAAAASKVSAFDSTVGMFRSVDARDSTSGNPLANFNVLIDHTMDVEMVYRAASLTKNSEWIKLANDHMEKLETTLVRPDGSTYQLGYFNAKSGKFIDGETKQGYSNSSTWSRGQAWAMYSFTAAYAARGRADFLATAEKVSDYFIDHLPADGIPYWDFNAPVTATTPKDSSAAAIAADALLRLAKLIPGTADATRYQNTAEQILTTLASPAYLAEGSKSGGILLHGALWVAKGETNESLSFGDYYFLDALNRFEGLV